MEEGKKLKQQQERLPIYNYKEQIVNQIMKGDEQVYLLCGETGSGKTTQLPQYIYDEMIKRGQQGLIGITQPRRVAAITVSERVSQEMQGQVGGLVGYSVRFDQKYSKATRIKFMTDGMLLRECIVDPFLSHYSFILIDEAHERSMHSDILLGLLKIVMRKRRDLKVIVMSATIEIEKFSRYLGLKGSSIIQVEGRCHPIDIYYTQTAQSDYVDAMLQTVLQIHMDHLTTQGDILAFMTGQEDIEDLLQLLNTRLKTVSFVQPEYSLQVVPLYSALSNEQQMLAFQPSQAFQRKVILCTNIAETSVTVPGVRYVVDSGLSKQREYHCNKGIETLLAIPISRSQAEQRAGRAGRVQSGKCFRLYTQDSHDNIMKQHQKPEILRLNLNQLYLQLYAIKHHQPSLDIQAFPYLDAPREINVKQSIIYLLNLGALVQDSESTSDLSCLALSEIPVNSLCMSVFGQELSCLPVEPHLGAMLLLGVKGNVTSQVLTLVSLMSVDSIFHRGEQVHSNHYKALKPFITANSDHLTILNLYVHYHYAHNKKGFAKEQHLSVKVLKKVGMIREQLTNYLKNILTARGDQTLPMMGVCEEVEVEKSLTCLSQALNQNTARLNQDGSYTLKYRQQNAHIHPDSVCFYLKDKPEYIVFNQVIITKRLYLRDVSSIPFGLYQSKVGQKRS